MPAIEYILLAAGFLLLSSIIASKASSRLGVPALLLFLLLGMLAGSEGPGRIYFDDARLAQSLGVVALIFILFSGGLDTDWKSVRSVMWMGLALSTLGVLLTALFVAVFSVVVIGLSPLTGFLLGAIVSSTDAAAVFSVLRSRKASLKGEIKPLLELESGSNDPMAVFLTIGMIELMVTEGKSGWTLVPMFFQQMAVGGILGYVGGKLMPLVINRLRLEYEGLYPVLSVAMVVLIYGASTALGGNGFLSVYVAGLVMNMSDFIHKKSLIRFHDGLAWLMQIAMFVALGLLIFPSRIVPIIGTGLLVSAFLMFAARPASIFVTLLFSRLDFRERLMVSWVGLRGAVPIILATFPLLAGIPQADFIFDLVFFIVLTSVLLQGTSIPLVARWLDLDAPLHEKTRYPLEFEPTEGLKSVLVELEVPRGSAVEGKEIVTLGLPKKALIVLIGRDNEFIIPSGGTTLMPGDKLLVLADKSSLAEVRATVNARMDQKSITVGGTA